MFCDRNVSHIPSASRVFPERESRINDAETKSQELQNIMDQMTAKHSEALDEWTRKHNAAQAETAVEVKARDEAKAKLEEEHGVALERLRGNLLSELEACQSEGDLKLQATEAQHAARMADLEHEIQNLQESQSHLKSEHETTKETYALSMASVEARHQQALDAKHQEQQARELELAELRASQDELLQAKHQEELSARENEMCELRASHEASLEAVELVKAEHEEALTALKSAESNAQELENRRSEMRMLHEETIDAQRSEHTSMSAAAAHEHEQELRQLTKEATDKIAKQQTFSDSQVPMNSSWVDSRLSLFVRKYPPGGLF